MEGKSRTASDFEGKILDFLNKMKFANVNGGPAFTINGIQVDACGGHEDTLLVIQATTQRKYLRNKIKEFRGEIPSLKRGFKKHDIYNSYRKFKFFIATNKKEIPKNDKEFAKEKPYIHLWDKRFIEYYLELYDSIKEYAKYNLLGEMGIKPLVEDHIIVPSFKCPIDNYVLYNFYLDPKTLLKTSYVARREIGKEKYYQRMVNKGRLGTIAKYVDGNNGMFPNNLIICFEEQPEFVRKKDVESSFDNWPKKLQFGFLKFPKHYRSTWIIDGQHRLYSFARSRKNSRMSIAAFHSLDEEKQAGFFIDINKEQKPVERNLLWDLDGQMRPKSKEGRISNVVKELNRIDPLKDKIYIPLEGVGKRGKLKLASLCTAIEKRKFVEATTESKVKNPYYDSTNYKNTVKNCAKNIGRYLTIVRDKFDERINKGFIFTNGGFTVMVTIFERIITRQKKNPTDKEIEYYISPVVDYLKSKTPSDLKDLRQGCASEAGKRKVFEELARTVQKHDNRFAEDVKTPYFDELKNLEKQLRISVQAILENASENWLKENVPGDVYSKAKSGMTKERGDRIWEFFGLGDCRKIIEMQKNWKYFEPVFTHKEYGYISKSDFFSALDLIIFYRNPDTHKRGYEFGYGDEGRLILSINKIFRCIEVYMKSATEKSRSHFE